MATKTRIAKNVLYYFMCSIYGGIIALIVWAFLKVMALSQELLWEYIPSKIHIPFYTIIVCLIGGVLIGIIQTKYGILPDELNTVMGKVKKENFYPYENMGVVLICALLPLIFGGSVGPEAGLTGVIVGLCYWAGDHLNKINSRLVNIQSMSLTSVIGVIFGTPLFGFAVSFEEHIKYYRENKFPKLKKVLSNLICGFSAFGAYFLISKLLGGGMSMPRIDFPEITNYDRMWSLAIIAIGIVAGIFYIAFEKLADVVFEKLDNKLPHIVSTVLGGLILGIMGTYFPLTMFSGEEQIEILGETYRDFAPYLLIVTGVLKLMITSICIKSGFRGGHFFPVIFSGISIGYGVAVLFGFNISFCTAVVTASLLGVVMKKPIAVSLLLMLCFPLRIIPWLVIGAFVASLVPVDKIFKKAKS